MLVGKSVCSMYIHILHLSDMSSGLLLVKRSTSHLLMNWQQSASLFSLKKHRGGQAKALINVHKEADEGHVVSTMTFICR